MNKLLAMAGSGADQSLGIFFLSGVFQKQNKNFGNDWIPEAFVFVQAIQRMENRSSSIRICPK